MKLVGTPNVWNKTAIAPGWVTLNTRRVSVAPRRPRQAAPRAPGSSPRVAWAPFWKQSKGAVGLRGTQYTDRRETYFIPRRGAACLFDNVLDRNLEILLIS